MRTIKSIVLFALLFGVTQVQAQDKITMIKLGGNLLGLSSNGDGETYLGGGLSIEQQLARKTSLGLNIDFNTKSSSYSAGLTTLDARLSITTIEPEFRFYPKAATDGFYVGGALALHLLKAKISGSISADGSDTQFGAGLVTGYQFVLAKALHLQIGGGLGYILPKDDSDGALKYNLNLMLGFQF